MPVVNGNFVERTHLLVTIKPSSCLSFHPAHPVWDRPRCFAQPCGERMDGAKIGAEPSQPSDLGVVCYENKERTVSVTKAARNTKELAFVP